MCRMRDKMSFVRFVRCVRLGTHRFIVFAKTPAKLPTVLECSLGVRPILQRVSPHSRLTNLIFAADHLGGTSPMEDTF